ncbi:hypothetical protein C4580_01745 [Candidatus Woesearchaeota archaeon]|nr:MAG: hypothetical protein C4580_01745 [Candidatus Woesearchaeota archaeon]
MTNLYIAAERDAQGIRALHIGYVTGAISAVSTISAQKIIEIADDTQHPERTARIADYVLGIFRNHTPEPVQFTHVINGILPKGHKENSLEPVPLHLEEMLSEKIRQN